MAPNRLLGKDDELDYIQLYNVKPTFFHFYVGPWLLIYGLIAYVWLFVFGLEEFLDVGRILFCVAAFLHALVFLSCQWSVHVKCALTCSVEPDPYQAEFVKVVPLPNNGSPEVVKLVRVTESEDRTVNLWFQFQKLKYVYEGEEKKQFELIRFPDALPFDEYSKAKGFVDDAAVAAAVDYFGKNLTQMELPKFVELFKQRVVAPFFVFQTFCVFLWLLDDYAIYGVFTLAMLVVFEALQVSLMVRTLKEISDMGSKPYNINVYRNRRWRQLLSSELCPGDLVSVTRSLDMLPCDLVLIRGSCIVDESLLTGESIPVMKESVEAVNDADRSLDLLTDKLHLLSGGTKIIQHNPPPKEGSGMTATDNGCLAYVIRTGFNTSKGRLLRTIMFSVTRQTANNKESFGFIVFLLAFAIAAASYVWNKGVEDPERSRYKLFVECALIIVTVIPPELPIELSLAVTQSVKNLKELSIYCTEGFRMPFAGKLEVCCFDKTGTLTADTIVVEGIAGLDVPEGPLHVTPSSAAPLKTIETLATCHSLAMLDDDVIGDPLEKSTLSAIDWTLTRGQAVVPGKMKTHGLKIFQRFHFNSTLKRMSVVAGHTPWGSSDVEYMVTVKGAPEVLQSRFSSIPDDYESSYLNFARKGARVLALGYRDIGKLTHQQVRDMTRDEAETDLTFAGFLIVSCPLKLHSKKAIKEIIHSSHHVVMITGDNPLTACHVAKELKFVKKETLIYYPPDDVDDQYHWASIDGQTVLHSVPSVSQYDLCFVGPSLRHMMSESVDIFRSLLPHVKVFARMSPKQKEQVVNEYKTLGWHVLMCGDGTNDVGALKHAHVGVALLSAASLSKPDAKKFSSPAANGHTAVAQNTSRNAGGRRTKERPASKSQQKPDSQRKAPVQELEKPEKPAPAPAELAIQQMMEEMEAQAKADIVQFGDASIAAPFTSKFPSIECVCHIIRQGRCTLVTTLMLFKVMGINALICAYCMSVLYLDGVKASEAQQTLQGILIVFLSLNIATAKPLDGLSKQRPLKNIFNLYTLLTVTCQFAIHLGCLMSMVKMAKDATPSGKPGAWDAVVDQAKEFEPSILNTSVWLMQMVLQTSNYAVNYRGRPFMESITENKKMLYTLTIPILTLVAIVLGWFPEFTLWFQLVEFEGEYRTNVIKIICVDIFGAFLVDRVLLFLLGSSKLRLK